MAQPRKPTRKSTSTRGKSSASGSALSQTSKGASRTRSDVGAVLSQPSSASQSARLVERTFAAGVDSALRIARARGVAVTVQDDSGKLVRGIPRQRGGSFTIKDEGGSR